MYLVSTFVRRLPRHKGHFTSQSLVVMCGPKSLLIHERRYVSNPSQSAETRVTAEQLARAERKDKELRSKHNYSTEDSTIDLESRRRRIIYRSKQRGLLEVDLLLGSWATENVPRLSEQELDEYETFLAEETIDIFNFVTKKDQLPAHLKDFKVIKQIQDYSLRAGVHSPTAYADMKQKSNLT
jgi:succinate dehydrogenase flavin-adding protein (antitoxin of CptAB toxin-antitoxin module)